MEGASSYCFEAQQLNFTSGPPLVEQYAGPRPRHVATIWQRRAVALCTAGFFHVFHWYSESQIFTHRQHPKDTPANAPLTRQSQDYGNVAAIELDAACAARADLSGITMQQVHACLPCLLDVDIFNVCAARFSQVAV